MKGDLKQNKVKNNMWIIVDTVDIYLLKVNIRNTRARFEICSILTIKTKIKTSLTPMASL